MLHSRRRPPVDGHLTGLVLTVAPWSRCTRTCRYLFSRSRSDNALFEPLPRHTLHGVVSAQLKRQSMNPARSREKVPARARDVPFVEHDNNRAVACMRERERKPERKKAPFPRVMIFLEKQCSQNLPSVHQTPVQKTLLLSDRGVPKILWLTRVSSTCATSLRRE